MLMQIKRKDKTMKKIEKLEQAKQQKANFKEWGINPTFYWAYQKTLDINNETIDFEDVVWEKDVEQIIRHCKEFHIKTITISSNFSGAIQILGMFADNGCKIKGMKKVFSQYTEFMTHKNNIINAVEIEINM